MSSDVGMLSSFYHRFTPALARVVRPVLLCTAVVGIAMTLALGPAVVRPGQAGAQTGYGDTGPSGLGSDTVPPRGLIIGSAEGGTSLLFAGIVLGALAAGAAGSVTYVVRNRRSQD